MAGTYTQLIYHVVFSTKNRYGFITSALEDELHRYVRGIIRELGGDTLETNGMNDHVHLLLRLPPKLAVSDALRTIKASSSKWVNESKPGFHKFGWQDGFAAFTVSRSQVGIVSRYIREQKSHHARTDFQTEYVALLKKHGVDFDPSHIWG